MYCSLQEGRSLPDLMIRQWQSSTPSGLVILFPALPVVVLVGLGRPCIVPSHAFVAPVLAVLLDISVAVVASIPFFSAGEHILWIDDIIVSLPLPIAALLPPAVLSQRL